MNIDTLKDQTIIQGTMRSEDLYPAFRSLLVLLDPEKAQGYSETLDSVEEYNRGAEVLYLMDDLDVLAPEGYYFGAHPGDGSDYGFWKGEDDDLWVHHDQGEGFMSADSGPDRDCPC